MTNEQYDIAEKAKNKPKRERSPEEEAAIKKQQELKKEREKVLRLLRAVSIRLPMLIYGARVDIEEDIPMEKFIEIVDDESWDEFMPEGVTKSLFKNCSNTTTKMSCREPVSEFVAWQKLQTNCPLFAGL